MLTTIHDVGIISNELMIKGAANPHECHDYRHQIDFSEEYGETEEYVSEEWSLSGDVPVGISIDNTGVVQGYVAIFDEQPSCQDNFPDEVLKVDGSNWENIGRYKHTTYQFNFTVTRITTYQDTLLMEEFQEIATSNISILVIKDNDINNLIFVKKYLEAGHELKIENDSYFEDDLEDFLARHDGPFGQCSK